MNADVELALENVIRTLKEMNEKPEHRCRELSLAITHCEEASHWLDKMPKK